MRNLFTKASIIAGSLIFAAQVYAAPALSVRIMQPKSPTNQSSLKLTVVTLDRLGRAVTVKCFKKGPSDPVAVQFGSDKLIPSGGDSGVCTVTSSIIGNKGTYDFYATATSTYTETSEVVTVDFNTEGPGTPTNYSKGRQSDCDYKINFKSADDSGKTVKVEVYRNQNKEFNADSSTRIRTFDIGSNVEVSFIDSAPGNCQNEYYYAVRAFDAYGNGSGIVGDSAIKVTTTTTSTTTTTVSEAIPVGNVILPAEGEVLGKATKEGETVKKEKEGEILGKAQEMGKTTKSLFANLWKGLFSSKGALLFSCPVVKYLAKEPKAITECVGCILLKTPSFNLKASDTFPVQQRSFMLKFFFEWVKAGIITVPLSPINLMIKSTTELAPPSIYPKEFIEL